MKETLFSDGEINALKAQIAQGMPLFSRVWQSMIGEHVRLDIIMDLAYEALEKDVWLPDEVLVYIMEQRSGIEERGLLKRIFTKKKSGQVLEFLNRYHKKHPEVRWSDAFVRAALKRADFKELFLRFKFELPADAQVELVKRDDFIDIINKWPHERFWFEKKAQEELIRQPFAKLLAYSEKAKALLVFDEFVAGNNFTAENAKQLMESLTSSPGLSKEGAHKLLLQKDADLTEMAVRARSDNPFDLDDQQLIVATSNPQAILAYARPAYYVSEAKVFDVSLQDKVLQILSEQAHDELAKYVDCLLTSDAEHLNPKFVAWLSKQPLSFLKSLNWKHRAVADKVDFWLNTLDTNKTALFMRFYKDITVNYREFVCLRPFDEVLKKMLTLPNAPELVAIWDHEAGRHTYQQNSTTYVRYDDNQYNFNNELIVAMKSLPEEELVAIYNIASPALKQKLKS